MQLTLTEDEGRTLRDFLRAHLQDLQFEVARTDAKNLRHTLVERQNLIERLIGVLDGELGE